MQQVLIATNNRHKLEELKPLLPGFEILSLNDIGFTGDLPEEQDTLEGNSLQKAEYVFRKFNMSCVADDTGLEVEALRGAPGVHSARFAGEQKSSEDNIRLLLGKLKQESNRRARFRTVITLRRPEGVSQFESLGTEGQLLTLNELGGAGPGWPFQHLPVLFRLIEYLTVLRPDPPVSLAVPQKSPTPAALGGEHP